MIKQTIFTLCVLVGSAWAFEVQAIHNTSPGVATDASVVLPTMTVNDYLAFNYKGYRTAEGKKLKWTQRLAIGMSQKKLAKKIRKGELEGSASLEMAMPASGNNTHGLLSIIFAFAGLVVPLLGLGLIIAGLVLGIIGISRDYNPTMAIVGTALNGAFLLLLLLVLAIFAAGGWFWF